MKTVLTIAGSDPSGGAGIQADLKTIAAHGLYGMSAITALTAQNTTGVYGVMEVPPDFLASQLDCIFTDIFPDSIKIGMVSNYKAMETIAGKLEGYGAQNILVDPVMVSTSGRRLMDGNTQETLFSKLIPLAAVVTPNLPEAEALCGFPIQDISGMERAAEKIGKQAGAAVLVKGGHLTGKAVDVLWHDGTIKRFWSERVQNPNTHGTGCTLSSAIACNLALGLPLEESVQRAKDYLTAALKAMLDLGKGNGPLDHTYRI